MLRTPLLRSSLLVSLVVIPACETGGGREGEGEGNVADEGEGEGNVVSEGEGEGTVVSEGEGEGTVVAEGEGEGTAVAEGEGEGTAVAEGEGEGTAVAEGEGEGAAVNPAATLKVLLIGNSQLGLNPSFIGDALEDLSLRAHGGSNPLDVTTEQAFGANCNGFIGDAGFAGSALDVATHGNFDVVVFLPSIDESGGNASCWDDMKGRIEGAGALFGIMATSNIAAVYPSGVQALHNSIKSYAESRSVLFIPAGDSLIRVIGTTPSAAVRNEFYANDNEHPSPEAGYLYVLALYGAITQQAVAGVPNDVPPLRCSLPGHAPTHNFVGDSPRFVANDAACPSFADYDADVDANEIFGGGVPFNINIFDARLGGHVSIVRPAEATTYQNAVQAALNARAANTR